MEVLLLTGIEGVVYAATALPHDIGYAYLDDAVASLLASVEDSPPAEVLWRVQYQQRSSSHQQSVNVAKGIVILPNLSIDLVLEDSILDVVKNAWCSITGEPEDDFMCFEARGGAEEDDD
jgi:Rab proteins geranylgeranyltransferase component A